MHASARAVDPQQSEQAERGTDSDYVATFYVNIFH